MREEQPQGLSAHADTRLPFQPVQEVKIQEMVFALIIFFV